MYLHLTCTSDDVDSSITVFAWGVHGSRCLPQSRVAQLYDNTWQDIHGDVWRKYEVNRHLLVCYTCQHFRFLPPELILEPSVFCLNRFHSCNNDTELQRAYVGMDLFKYTVYNGGTFVASAIKNIVVIGIRIIKCYSPFYVTCILKRVWYICFDIRFECISPYYVEDVRYGSITWDT